MAAILMIDGWHIAALKKIPWELNSIFAQVLIASNSSHLSCAHSFAQEKV